MRRLRSSSIWLTVLSLSALTNLFAQDTTRARPDTTRPPADTQPSPPPRAAAPSLPFEFSGILYANYQYGGVKGNRATNRSKALSRLRETIGVALAN